MKRLMLVALLSGMVSACTSTAGVKNQGEQCFGTAECAAGLVCDLGANPAVCIPSGTPPSDAGPEPMPDAAPAADAAPTPDAPAAPPPDAPPPDAPPPDAPPPDAPLPDAMI